MMSHLFTTRHGGLSDVPFDSLNLALHVGDDALTVAKNRALVLAPRAIFMNQVHGDTVAVIDGATTMEVTADAIITQERDIALSVMVADCIPLLLWDEKESTVGAVHVGRRGLVHSIAVKTLLLMKELGAANVRGVMGPSICGSCYEVGEDIFEEVVATHPEAASRSHSGKLALDLPRALEVELMSYGIAIERTNICTREDANYFSFRRNAITGRQAGYIWLT